jgi:aminoglycoside phosphotransferase (APT) family kinase protein
MTRDWRVTSALQDSPVPVVRTVAADLTGEVMGSPCTVVEWLDGRVVRSGDDLESLSGSEVSQAVDALVAALTQLHRVEPRTVGLGKFGRLISRLPATLPRRHASAVVHGDFRIVNAIISGRDAGTVHALVDSEMSKLGDPLTDVALMCAYRNPAFDVKGH